MVYNKVRCVQGNESVCYTLSHAIYIMQANSRYNERGESVARKEKIFSQVSGNAQTHFKI